MATIYGSTISTLLCGKIISDLTSATIRSLITSDSTADKSVLSDVTLDGDSYISAPYITQLVRDTGSTFTSSSGVYLSASSTSFANITSNIYDGSSSYYITNYIDTGVPSTSYLISYESKNTPIQGFTTYTIDDNKLLFFKDTDIDSRFTYRYFNELLITNAVGSLSTIGIALLSVTFPLNINNTNYTEISSFIIALTTVSPYIDTYYGASNLKQNGFISLAALSAGSVGSAIFYTNPTSAPSSRTLIGIVSGSSVGATYTTTQGGVVYFKPYQSTILSIS